MRTSILALAALAFLRIVIGLHFFLEGLSHLRDPDWSSAGFRKAAVGPLAAGYRAMLPETGDWSGTLGAADRRPPAEPIKAWQESVAAEWRRRLDQRQAAVKLAGEAAESSDRALESAKAELAGWVGDIREDLVEYRLELARLVEMESSKAARDIPFERERVAKKRRELSRDASGWMTAAAAIGRRLEAAWDSALPAADRERLARATPRTALWKADRFVSWSLVTIGACLVAGLFVKFNAMGGAIFLASVVASQPFWVPGAQDTYAQWVEMAALVALAALPTGGWSGLDYFLRSWCPLSCCGGKPSPGGTT